MDIETLLSERRGAYSGNVCVLWAALQSGDLEGL